MILREIVRQFVFVGKPVTRRLDGVIENYGLTLARWRVLDYIKRSKTCTLVEISRYLSIKKPSVTRTVDFLEKKKLIEEINGKDKRERRVRLTDSGKKLFTTCRSSLNKAEKEIFRDISDEEQKILLRLLVTIQKNMK